MQRLMALPGVKTLYCAHSDTPFVGDRIPATIQAGLDYLDRVDAAAKDAVNRLPAGAKPEDITRETLYRLGMAAAPVMPITIQSIMSHLR
jgi:hypothetical protein